MAHAKFNTKELDKYGRKCGLILTYVVFPEQLHTHDGEDKYNDAQYER